MDEPTNDLDVETLELLEELLINYKGTLLLVSHDRAFLDNVFSSTLVLEGRGRIDEYSGGHTDWLRQCPVEPSAAPGAKTAPSKEDAPPAAAKRKLSFKDQRSLDQLPRRIQQLESAIADQAAAMNDPAFFQQDSSAIVQANQALAALQADLDTAYAHWAELDG